MKKSDRELYTAAYRRFCRKFKENDPKHQEKEIGMQITVEYSIECTNCSAEGGGWDTKDYTVSSLINAGWVCKYGHCLCPSCAILSERKIYNGETR